MTSQATPARVEGTLDPVLWLVDALKDTQRHIRELADQQGYYSLAQIEADKRAAAIVQALIGLCPNAHGDGSAASADTVRRDVVPGDRA